MDSWLVATCSLVFLVLVAVYVRDRRRRPEAGGSALRWSLRWALLVVGVFLLTTVAFDTPFHWLRVVTTILLVVVVGLVGYLVVGSTRPGPGGRVSRPHGYRGD